MNAGIPTAGVVHHSDRGTAYTSLAFSKRIIDLDFDQSLGRTGDCYDNAAVESFFATLKRELAWIHATKTWATRAALRTTLSTTSRGSTTRSGSNNVLTTEALYASRKQLSHRNPCPQDRVKSIT